MYAYYMDGVSRCFFDIVTTGDAYISRVFLSFPSNYFGIYQMLYMFIIMLAHIELILLPYTVQIY